MLTKQKIQKHLFIYQEAFNLKIIIMKKLFFYYLLLLSISSLGQNSSELFIDNASTLFSNISFPYWLKSGQTINIGANTKTVSALEFNVDNNSLEFSQVLSINSLQTVPINKVWKIESIGLNNPNSNINLPNTSALSGNSTNFSSQVPTFYQSPKKFESPGVYNWVPPPGITSICVEVWGAGGNGYYDPNWGFSGGGGGGYGYKCFTVSQGTTYKVTVGNNGQNSSFDNLITATAGSNAALNKVNYSCCIIAGTGGSASSTIGDVFIIQGGSGEAQVAGAGGGTGGNGGNGGIPCNPTAPGGGGGGCSFGTNGTRGQVYIHW